MEQLTAFPWYASDQPASVLQIAGLRFAPERGRVVEKGDHGADLTACAISVEGERTTAAVRILFALDPRSRDGEYLKDLAAGLLSARIDFCQSVFGICLLLLVSRKS